MYSGGITNEKKSKFETLMNVKRTVANVDMRNKSVSYCVFQH